MKKNLLILFIVLCRTVFPQAPVTDTIHVNTYEDAINLTYGLLPKSHYPSGILLNKSNPFAKAIYANGQLNDSTFNMSEWYYLQNAVRISSNNPDSLINFLKIDSLKNDYIEKSNTLPWGILDIKAHLLKDSALMDGSITVNNYRLMENTIDLKKMYDTRKVFCVAPLNMEINTLNPQFILYPDFIFSNNTHSVARIQIDMDDGAGYRDVLVNSAFQASYAEGGFKNFMTRIIYDNNDTLYSGSEIYVNDPEVLNKVSSSYENYSFKYDVLSWPDTYPSEFSPNYQFKKVEVGVWWGCNNTSGEVRKPFVIFAGYNPKDGKSLEYNGFAPWINDNLGAVMSNALGGWRGTLYETYNGFYTDASRNAPSQSFGSNGNNFLDKIRKEGYDVLIVRFMDGIGYMQYNAHLVTQVIKDVNNRINNSLYVYNPGAALDPEAPGYPNTNRLKKPKHEIIVQGYSAGALSSRMGLLLMEYQYQQHKCLADAWKYPKHRVKLWIGFDCENQGSNVPIGLQMFFDFQKSVLALSVNAADVVNSIICKQALDLLQTNGVATQNTLYHLDNMNYAGSQTWNVGHHGDFNDFFSDLNDISIYNPANLKGFPKECYRIGISQGSANGVQQLIAGGSNRLIYNEAPTSFCFAFPVTNTWSGIFGLGALSITPYKKAEGRVLSPSSNDAFYCQLGTSFRTFFYSWHVEFDHWKYHKDNYIQDQYMGACQPYDITSGSTLTSHVILGKKMPLSSTSLALAAVQYCNYKEYNSNYHGFSPTPSSLDLHTPGNNTLPRLPNLSLTPSALNLLYQNNYSGVSNHQPPNLDFGYPHVNHPNDHYDITPYDAVWANGIHTSSNYDDNTMHVEDPSPHIGEFLVEEVAPATLYLSNRTIQGDPLFCSDAPQMNKYYADFEARNSVLAGNQEVYKNDNVNPNNYYPRLRTSPGDFIIGNGGVVTIRANNGDGQSKVVLGPGFSAKNGSIFRAYVYGDAYCAPFSYGHRDANNSPPAQPEREQRKMIAKRAFSTLPMGNDMSISMALYPNPTTGLVYYNIKENAIFNYQVTNVQGEIIQTGKLTESQNQVDFSQMKPGVYLITIQKQDYTQTDRIILE